MTPLALVLLRPVLVLQRAWLGRSRRAGRCGATRTQILPTQAGAAADSEVPLLALWRSRQCCLPGAGDAAGPVDVPLGHGAGPWAEASVFLSCACIFLKVNLVTDLQILQCSLASIKSCS